MTFANKIAITITIILLSGLGILAFAVYEDKINNQCGLSLEEAKAKVSSIIADRKLPPEYIKGPIDQRGSCRYGFNYLGQGEHLYFVVESTWSEGTKITFIDYIRQNQQ